LENIQLQDHLPVQTNSYYDHTDALGDFYGGYVHIIEYASNVL